MKTTIETTTTAIPIFTGFLLSIVLFMAITHKPAPKYEYHVILNRDTVLVFNSQDKEIGRYLATQNQFDSIVTADNL